jgi:hypothetical protein
MLHGCEVSRFMVKARQSHLPHTRLSHRQRQVRCCQTTHSGCRSRWPCSQLRSCHHQVLYVCLLLAVDGSYLTPVIVTSKTDIPVPSILEWTEDNDNTVGHPYLMMEHATGVSLHDIWSKLRGDWKKKCVKAICRQLTKTTQLCFPAYGSLYLSDTSSVPSSCKIQIGNNFCIEPQCGPIEQDLYAREPFIPGSGPCKSFTSSHFGAQTESI